MSTAGHKPPPVASVGSSLIYHIAAAVTRSFIHYVVRHPSALGDTRFLFDKFDNINKATVIVPHLESTVFMVSRPSQDRQIIQPITHVVIANGQLTDRTIKKPVQ